MYNVGDYIEKSGTLRQVHLLAYRTRRHHSRIKKTIKEIQDTVKVLDDKGNDMLLPPFDIDRINSQDL